MLMPQEKIGQGTIGILSKEPLALDLSCDDFVRYDLLQKLLFLLFKYKQFNANSFVLFYLLICIKNTVLTLVCYLNFT